MNLPILYSFRRCPYAMRARLALHVAKVVYEIREISLKNKPQSMLAISPKGTVPVLQLPNGQVVEESYDIMKWALKQHDPQENLSEVDALVERNDREFKHALDRYKYPDRFGEESSLFWRQQGETFLQDLEKRLTAHSFLFSEQQSISDLAIFPFVRQFAHVDKEWFENSPYPRLQQWYNYFMQSPEFKKIMQKYPVWEQTGDAHSLFVSYYE